MDIKKLLKLREIIKKRKPDFIRQEYFKHKRLKAKWRRPKGRKSWLRREKKGRGSLPSPGYSSPKLVRGLNKCGYKEIIVRNPKDITNLNPKIHAVVIASNVGRKKRLKIVEEAMKRNIKVMNL